MHGNQGATEGASIVMRTSSEYDDSSMYPAGDVVEVREHVPSQPSPWPLALPSVLHLAHVSVTKAMAPLPMTAAASLFFPALCSGLHHPESQIRYSYRTHLLQGDTRRRKPRRSQSNQPVSRTIPAPPAGASATKEPLLPLPVAVETTTTIGIRALRSLKHPSCHQSSQFCLARVPLLRYHIVLAILYSSHTPP